MNADRSTMVSDAALVVGAMLIVVPLLSLISAWPPQLWDLQWRLQQSGTVVAALPPVVLGLAVCMYSARLLGHSRIQLAVGLVSLPTAAVLVIVGANFLIDGFGFGSMVSPEEQAGVRLTTVRMALESVVITIALLAVGVSSLRWFREEVRSRTRQKEYDRGLDNLVAAPLSSSPQFVEKGSSALEPTRPGH